MIRYTASCLVLAALVIASPRLATAGDVVIVYDAVDALETRPNEYILVTGVIGGQNAQSTTPYQVGVTPQNTNTDAPARCERFAMMAMSKPGKFQFAVVFLEDRVYSCRLIARTP